MQVSKEEADSIRRLLDDSIIGSRHMCGACGISPFPEVLTDHMYECAYAEVTALLDGTTFEDLIAKEHEVKMKKLVSTLTSAQVSLLKEICSEETNATILLDMLYDESYTLNK